MLFKNVNAIRSYRVFYMTVDDDSVDMGPACAVTVDSPTIPSIGPFHKLDNL